MEPSRPPWHRDPTTGRLLLDAERTVVLTGEEHHQDWLRRYVPHPGVAPRQVLLTLAFGLATRGERTGQGTIEALLDGRRVGELTHRMTSRYQPLLRTAMGDGGRPDCRGRLIIGRRGLVEVELGLPAVADSGEARPVVPAGASTRKRIGIGAAAVTALLVLVGMGVGGARSTETTRAGAASGVGDSSSTAPESASAVTIPSSTVVVPEPTEAATDDATRNGPTAGSRTAVARAPSRTLAPPAAAPVRQTTAPRRAAAAETGQGGCHPSYGDCVPIAADVDCEGGGGNGPKFVRGPIPVVGSDDYGLDRDGDGVACESDPDPVTRSTTTTTTTSKGSQSEPDDDCDPNYGGCVPVASDVDCAGGSGDGPKYVTGPIRVTGSDVYGLDRDGNGIACD